MNNYIKRCIYLICICIGISSCNQQSVPEDHLPKESVVVVKTDTKQILMKLLLGNLSEFSLSSIFKQSEIKVPKTALDSLQKALNNPTDAGIDLLSDTYTIISSQKTAPSNHFGVFYFHLSDAKKFSTFVKNKVPKSYGFESFQSENTFEYGSLDDRKVIGWNSNFAMLVVPLNSEANATSFFKELIALKEQDLVVNNANYEQFENESSDLKIWINNTDNNLQKLTKLEESSIFLDFLKNAYQHIYINFDDGKITCDNKTYVDEATQTTWKRLFDSEHTNSTILNSFNEEKISGFMNLRHNPLLITRLTEIFIQQSVSHNPAVALLFVGAGITPDALAKMLNGNILVASTGITEIEQEVITYGYDENFNRVPQKKTQTVQVPEIIVSMSAKPEIQNMLNKFRLAGVFQQENEAYVLSFSGMKFYADYKKGNLLISNNLNTLQATAKPTSQHRLSKLVNSYPLSTYVDIKQTQKLLESYLLNAKNLIIPSKEFIFRVNGLKDHIVESEIDILMDNNAENALIQLSKMTKRQEKSTN